MGAPLSHHATQYELKAFFRGPDAKYVKLVDVGNPWTLPFPLSPDTSLGRLADAAPPGALFYDKRRGRLWIKGKPSATHPPPSPAWLPCDTLRVQGKTLAFSPSKFMQGYVGKRQFQPCLL